MINFQQYLKMGGNVVIGSDAAQRIDLTNIDRQAFVTTERDSLTKISDAFKRQTGLVLWDPSLIRSGQFLSGSAFHFFNTGEINDKDFKAVKPSVGDLDTKVDVTLAPFLRTWLDNNRGRTYGDLTLIGYKISVGQFITLWKSKRFGINIQVDMEQVDFDNGKPTDWAAFSHYSSWEDMQQNVKGVAHKYLLRALNAKNLADVIIRTKTGKEKIVKASSLAFSTSGLRTSMEPILDQNGNPEYKNGMPVFRKLDTSETGFNTDLQDIYITYFGGNPSKQQMNMMWSFTGLLQLVKTHYSRPDQLKVADGFMNTLWGSAAQMLYRNDPNRDYSEKMAMATLMCQTLGLDINRWLPLAQAFYK